MEKKILTKVAQSSDITYFNRQIAKLNALAQPNSDYIRNQLLGIAEGKHKFADLIFKRVLEYSSKDSLV